MQLGDSSIHLVCEPREITKSRVGDQLVFLILELFFFFLGAKAFRANLVPTQVHTFGGRTHNRPNPGT